MEIIVTDRSTIERGMLVQSAYVVISIRDPDRSRARIPKQSGLREVLHLAFHDAEPTEAMALPDDIKLMTKKQAAQIWAFIEKHRATIATLVVHCEQGMSRSPAVAAAITKGLGLDDCRYWLEYQPNRFVYELVLTATAITEAQ